MTQTGLEDPENNFRAQKFIDITDQFIETFETRARERHSENATERIIRQVFQGETLRGEYVGQQPERFVTDHLIEPMLTQLGYDVRPEPYGLAGLGDRRPDYLITNVDDPLIIVEVKTPNEICDAQQESFDYLADLDSRVAAGISTDGFTWNLHWAVGEEIPTREGHQYVRRAMNRVRKDPEDYRELRSMLFSFVDTFQRRSILARAREHNSTLASY